MASTRSGTTSIEVTLRRADPGESFGLYLVQEGKRIVVSRMEPGSPAERCGLLTAGLELEKVDGKIPGWLPHWEGGTVSGIAEELKQKQEVRLTLREATLHPQDGTAPVGRRESFYRWLDTGLAYAGLVPSDQAR